MNSANAAQELDFLAEQYITNLGIKTHKDLKRVGEFKNLPEDSQRKIYDKVRYRTQKGSLKLITEPGDLGAGAELIKTSKSKQGFIKNIPTLLLLVFIFCFLASESINFYDQFEILPIFKFSIPVIIEFSVILLSLKKSRFAKALLTGLIVFNATTFIYKTIECDKNTRSAREDRFSKITFLKEQKSKLEKQYQEVSSELLFLKNQHNDLVSKNFFRLASGTYDERIRLKEAQFQKTQEKLEKTNLDILSAGLVRESNSFLSVNTFFKITLKCILQAIFVFLIFDLKQQKATGEI